MRFFVTGGTGFIGGHLIERLVAEGHEVVALVRTPAKAARLEQLGVEMVAGDLSVFADPDFTLDPVDVVVHLAGVVAAPSADVYEAVNYTAVVDLLGWLEAASWKPKRLLFASSQAAAGPNPSGVLSTEADPPRPVDPYGDAKARAEKVLESASFPVTSFRPPVVFGAGDQAFLTVFQLARRRVGARVSGEPQRLSWVYVDDLVSAILAMSLDEREGDYLYFASSHEQIDVLRLWSELSAAFDRRILVFPIPPPVLTLAASVAMRMAPILGLRNQLDHKQVAQMVAPSFQCSSEALSRDLGWRAEVGFADAVQRTADGYAELGWL